MQLTRRAFLASLAVCALSACSSGGGTASAPDKWHTIVVEGLQVSVPSDAELDDELTTSSDTINATTYYIKGDDILVQVDVLHDGGDITGDYDVREVNGMTVYVQEPADGVTDVEFLHDGKLYGVVLYSKQDTGTQAAYEAARDHLIESLEF